MASTPVRATARQGTETPAPAPAPGRQSRAAWIAAGAVVLAAATVLLTGAHRHLTYTTLVDNYEWLRGLVERHHVVVGFAYVAAYAVAVCLSIPGAILFSITGGVLFGALAGGCLAALSATLGATGVFFIARTALGGLMARRAGPLLHKIGEGFRAGAWSYMLFLRLVPLFPFALVNLAAAVFRVPAPAFVGATLLGILPATFAITTAGAALASVMHAQGLQLARCRLDPGATCHIAFDVGQVFTPHLLMALSALGALSLVPIIYRWWTGRRTT